MSEVGCWIIKIVVFEDFVRNFYRIEQDEFKVKRDEIEWDLTPIVKDAEDLLPKMFTDATLESEKRKIIIDTKFYQSTFQEHYGKTTIHSGNLYQMFSYIKNAEKRGGELNRNCEGILLYPIVKKELDMSYRHEKHKVHLKTVNLNQNWKEIMDRLIYIISERY